MQNLNTYLKDSAKIQARCVLSNNKGFRVLPTEWSKEEHINFQNTIFSLGVKWYDGNSNIELPKEAYSIGYCVFRDVDRLHLLYLHTQESFDELDEFPIINNE
jgi:hypothetical protein